MRWGCEAGYAAAQLSCWPCRRNGPGKFAIGSERVAHPLDGDGLVASVSFINGRAFFRSRRAGQEKERSPGCHCRRHQRPLLGSHLNHLLSIACCIKKNLTKAHLTLDPRPGLCVLRSWLRRRRRGTCYSGAASRRSAPARCARVLVWACRERGCNAGLGRSLAGPPAWSDFRPDGSPFKSRMRSTSS